jgi:hypothetical protein
MHTFYRTIACNGLLLLTPRYKTFVILDMVEMEARCSPYGGVASKIQPPQSQSPPVLPLV